MDDDYKQALRVSVTLDDAVTPQQLAEPDPIAEAIRRVEALRDEQLAVIARNEFRHFGALDPASVPHDAEAAVWAFDRVLAILREAAR